MVEKKQTLQTLVSTYLQDYFATHKNVLLLKNIHDTILKEVEKPLIIIILKETNYNQTKTAEVLGLNRNTLRKKIAELNIKIKNVSPK